MSRLPIRVRLTLGFAVAMAVVLAAVGLFVYRRVANELLRTVDQTLVGQSQEEIHHGGKVDSDTAKHAAEDIAKGINGVKSVKNDLQVVAPSTREAVEDKDDAITARVQKQIAKDSHLKKADIAVQTNAGVVSLTGEVPDIVTSANASWTAWFVPGVKSVKNDLTLKEKK